MKGMVLRAGILAGVLAGLGLAGGCRSKDVSGHNTYQSQPGDASDAAAGADTARDSAAPRVAP